MTSSLLSIDHSITGVCGEPSGSPERMGIGDWREDWQGTERRECTGVQRKEGTSTKEITARNKTDLDIFS